MKDKHKRTILRLELEVEASRKDAKGIQIRHHADLHKANDAALEAQNRVVELEAELADAWGERDGVQEENQELRSTLSREQEEWRQERWTLQSQVYELDAQLHAARQSGHARLGG